MPHTPEDMNCGTPEDSGQTGNWTARAEEGDSAGQLAARLKDLDETTTEAAIETLKTSPALATEAIRYLTGSSDQASLEVLQRLVSSLDRDLALIAARALGDCRRQAAGEAIIAVLAQGQVDKAVAKELRRSLHRLKSIGLAPVTVPPRKTSPETTKSRARSPYAAMVSQFDSSGGRILYFAARLPGGALQIINLLVNDMTGILDCEVLKGSRQEYAVTREMLLAAGDTAYVDIDPEYCRRLIWEYADRNRQSGRPLPRKFSLARLWLGEREERLVPPIYAYLPAEEITAQMSLLLSGSGELLQTDLMYGWTLPREPLADAARQLQERKNSPVWINELARAEQEERIRANALEKIMDSDFRQVFIRRLEETAYIFYVTGEERESRQALAVAVVLHEGKRRLVDIPLLTAMLDEGLAVLLGNGQPDRSGRHSNLWL
ncbi:MAG: hypothetical protein D9V47_05470 [Clostridia bacterium]|nr:MAG: hypothetical protein D9V47_05470 [Clostridia bacterium]